MTVFGVDFSPGALWLAAALLLVIAELIAPGFFLVFLGVGAGVTGIILLLVPTLGVVPQAIAFAGLTAAAVAFGRRWYRRQDVPSADPLLNDRAARLIGKRVEVCAPIVGGSGRVTVGDGAWNATGPDMPVGASATVVGASGAVLRVEPA